MLTVNFPEPAMQEVALVPEQRTVKGAAFVLPDSLKNCLSLGGAIVIALTPENSASDPDLRNFVIAEAGRFRYYMIQMACTFTPQNEEPFVRAWFQVMLTGQDGAASLPIAYSMTPESLAVPIENSSSYKLTADAKLVKAEAETKQTVKQEEAYLLALNQMEAQPVWQFSRTPNAAINGSYRLRMVVRAPHDVVARGTIALTATVEKKHFGIFPYRADVPPDAEIFDLA